MKNITQKIGRGIRRGLVTLLVPVLIGAGVSGCGEKEKPNPYRFQTFGKLNNGVEYGKIGSVKFLLDKEGNPISKGFHEIQSTDSGYVAILGACAYELNKNGNIVKVSDKVCLRGLPDYYEDYYKREVLK